MTHEFKPYVYINKEMGTIEMFLSDDSYYLEWAGRKGDGADIGLYRRQLDDRIIGCCLEFKGETIAIRTSDGNQLSSDEITKKLVDMGFTPVYEDDEK